MGFRGPTGAYSYEFLIAGQDRVGVLAAIATTFARQNVNLTMVGTYQSYSEDGFVLNVYADFSKALMTPDEVTRELLTVDSVKTVESAEVSGKKFDRFLFPTMLSSKTRGIIVPCTNIIAAEQYFIKSLGAQGKQILFETARQGGLQYAITCRKNLEKSNPEALLETIVDMLRSTGWGLFNFDPSKVEKGTVRVIVDEPIFAGTEGIAESWYTYGMSEGVIEGVFGLVSVVSNSKYAFDSHRLEFKLVERKGRGPERTDTAALR